MSASGRSSADVFQGKPILGVAGGIGSGKSFVAKCFERYGWVVINSDELAKSAYADAEVQQQLRGTFFDGFDSLAGQITRAAIANIIFQNAQARVGVERIIHPAVDRLRNRVMAAAAPDPGVMGFVWDSPLLFETGLSRQCDWIVFVDAPVELRIARVQRSRGWSDAEIARREISQLPLDTKRKMSQDVIRNGSDHSDVCSQIEAVLSRISERLNVRTVRPETNV